MGTGGRVVIAIFDYIEESHRSVLEHAHHDERRELANLVVHLKGIERLHPFEQQLPGIDRGKHANVEVPPREPPRQAASISHIKLSFFKEIMSIILTTSGLCP